MIKMGWIAQMITHICKTMDLCTLKWVILWYVNDSSIKGLKM